MMKEKIVTYYILSTLLISSFGCTVRLHGAKVESQSSQFEAKWAVSEIQGCKPTIEDQRRKPTMEDRHSVEHSDELDFFGVYDGHSGTNTVEFVKNHLHKNFFETKGKTTDQRLKNAFVTTDKDFLATVPKKDNSGSTAVVGLFDRDTNKLFIANTGDSRAIVVRDGNVFFTTKDHKPNNKSERTRITKAGSSVKLDKQQGVYRVYNPDKVQGGLAMSRAFGQRLFKNLGVIVDPDITEVDIKKNDILVLASDGLWDIIARRKVAKSVHSKLNGLIQDIVLNEWWIEEAARSLRDRAYEQDKTDDISVLIVKFVPTELNTIKDFITKITKWRAVGAIAIIASLYLLRKLLFSSNRIN